MHAVRDSDGGGEVEDGRLLVLEGELAQALAVSGREGNTLSATVRNAWDGISLGNLTKNNADRSSSPHISIIGHITRDELHKKLRDVEVGNGFANRFLWICVRRSKLLPEGGRFGDAQAAPFVDRLSTAVSFARKVGRMERDARARELWLAEYRRLSAPKLGLLDALTCRAEPHVMRLSCLYALLDQSATVRLEHMQAALAVWAYVEASCRHIFGEQSGDPVADTILEALREKPEGLTRTEVSALFGRNKSSRVLVAALDRLAEHGLAECRRVKTAGAPREVWRALWAGEEARGPQLAGASAGCVEHGSPVSVPTSLTSSTSSPQPAASVSRDVEGGLGDCDEAEAERRSTYHVTH